MVCHIIQCRFLMNIVISHFPVSILLVQKALESDCALLVMDYVVIDDIPRLVRVKQENERKCNQGYYVK